MSVPILQIENLSKTFKIRGLTIRALREANFEVMPGEFVAIMGPSGSGKTTLLSLVGCLDTPSEGKVVLGGYEITSLHDASLHKIRRDKIGFVFQTFNLIDSLTAIENVELPMENTIKSRKERRDKALKLLELVGLKERGKHRPVQMSAGEQQRVAIARALANDPAIILADEPTGSLDSQTGINIVNTLKQLSKDQGATILMVTHDDRMTAVADRVLSLTDGRIVPLSKN